MKRVLFYSSVPQLRLFEIGFYQTDIRILKELGFEVHLTNRIRDFLNIRGYDIAFLYFWTKSAVPALIARIFFKKVLITGGIDALDREFNTSGWNYWVKVFFMRLCTWFSNANLFVSRSDIENIRKTGLRVSRIAFSPHAIEVNKYRYDNRPKKNILSTICWMGSESNPKRKGVDKLFAALPEIFKNHPEVTLTVIGDLGAGTDFLKGLAQNLGVLDRIVFTGKISDEQKIDLLRDSRIYFQLSGFEGFGIAAIEAMSAGNLIIHSGKGALATVVGPSGFLVQDCSNPAEIAACVAQIMRNPDFYVNRIKTGMNHVEENYSYETRKNRLREVLESLASDFALPGTIELN